MAYLPFIGEICLFPFNFAPEGWADCDGQLLPIQSNTALFSIIGTIYGGNGISNFALPNLNGRVPVGAGAGQGLTPRSVGDSGGSAEVTLTASQLPPHTHALSAYDVRGVDNDVSSTARLARPAFGNAYGAPGAGVSMGVATTSVAGSSSPHENRQPFVGMRYCIALEGVFPPR